MADTQSSTTKLYYFLKVSSSVIAPGVAYNGEIPSGAVECTEAQYSSPANWTISNGAIVAYTPPAIPLSVQATSALTTARTYVNNYYTMLNKSTPTAWVTYLEALIAISDGDDTTSTTLPTEPTT